MNAHESADGYLVIDPVSPWILGPTDSPDVQLGGNDGATFSFFAPWTYPSGCAIDAEATTPQGWAVVHANGASWCDADAKVRVHVAQPQLVEAAIKGLRVKYTDAETEQIRSTSTRTVCDAPANTLERSMDMQRRRGRSDEPTGLLNTTAC